MLTLAVGGGQAVEGAHGITIQADATVADAPADLDAVVLPGGMPGAEHLGESPRCDAKGATVWRARRYGLVTMWSIAASPTDGEPVASIGSKPGANAPPRPGEAWAAEGGLEVGVGGWM